MSTCVSGNRLQGRAGSADPGRSPGGGAGGKDTSCAWPPRGAEPRGKLRKEARPPRRGSGSQARGWERGRARRDRKAFPARGARGHLGSVRGDLGETRCPSLRPPSCAADIVAKTKSRLRTRGMGSCRGTEGAVQGTGGRASRTGTCPGCCRTFVPSIGARRVLDQGSPPCFFSPLTLFLRVFLSPAPQSSPIS